MTKDYMQNFNPPGRSYLTGILKGCRQNKIPTEPILKAARKPPVPGQTQKPAKKQRKPESRKKPMKILQRFSIICLAVTLTSAGFLIYHMVYLQWRTKSGWQSWSGNFPEPEAPGASGSEKKDQPAVKKNARWLR